MLKPLEKMLEHEKCFSFETQALFSGELLEYLNDILATFCGQCCACVCACACEECIVQGKLSWADFANLVGMKFTKK